MAKRLSRATFAFLTGLGLASCNAITGAGDLEVDDVVDASGVDARVVDAGLVETSRADVQVLGPGTDATIVDACSPTGCLTPPPGFQLVAFGADASNDCPSGFGSPVDVVSDASIGANACSCDCNVTAPPTCPATGMLQATFSSMGGTTCPTASPPITAACEDDGFMGPFSATTSRRYVPPPIAGGTCNATPKKDATKLSSNKTRICQASVVPRCGQQICPPALGGAFKACFAAPGTVDCPAELPERKVVGGSADFTCEGTCGCEITGQCTGTVRFYNNPTCAPPAALQFVADGKCSATPAPGGGPYLSHRYVPNSAPTPTSIGCKKTGSASPSPVALTQVATVCCN